MDELTRLRAELAEPLALDAGELERLAPFSAAGTCTGCHTPLVPPRTRRCWACAELDVLKIGQDDGFPVPQPASRCQRTAHHRYCRNLSATGPPRLLLLVGGIALFWACGYLWAPLFLPALVCIIMAARR